MRHDGRRMKNSRELEKPAGDATSAPPSGDQAKPLLHQAQLAREERSAALRALAGRLAHQLRNPLAAVRAACSSLRSDSDDVDQRETLDLTLQEIDRMLGFVKATVQAMPDDHEESQVIDVSAEMADVVGIVQAGHADQTLIHLTENRSLRCRLPRNGLRVSIFSVLDHLAGVANVDAIHVDVRGNGDRVLIRFAVSGGSPDDNALTTGMMVRNGWAQPVGLLVAERFARALGGDLSRADDDATGQIFTIDLPCADV